MECYLYMYNVDFLEERKIGLLVSFPSAFNSSFLFIYFFKIIIWVDDWLHPVFS